MRTIWKFMLETTDDQAIEMPKYSQILTVQEQYERPCLWAFCDPQEERVTRHIRIYGTGHNLPDDPGVYLGTYQIANGGLVFHVFEKISKVTE